MPNREFLESYPLYRKFRSNLCLSTTLDDISKPSINMYCSICKSKQTFNMNNEYYELEGAMNTQALDTIVRALYVCKGCDSFNRLFFIKFEESVIKDEEGDEVSILNISKVGQSPPWEIEPDKKLSDMLGESQDYYKKGIVCESQSYGIGAYAYYRRITENIIGQLLESISELLNDADKMKYDKALKDVRKTKIAEEKIKLVKELLPESLKVDGLNPLGTMYDVLSAGIHDKSDEECMDQAEIIRNCLVFLVNQVVETKEDKKYFFDNIKKILDKKAKK